MKTEISLKISTGTLLGLILLLTIPLMAIEKNQGTLPTLPGKNGIKESAGSYKADSEWQPATSIFFELGGKFIYSLNVDFRKRANFAFSFGGAYIRETKSGTNEYVHSVFVPSVMGYYFSGKKHGLELGGGLGTLIGSHQGLAAMTLHGVAGYRYQKKRDVIFRAGFTPFIAFPIAEDARFQVVPLIGISLGYCF